MAARSADSLASGRSREVLLIPIQAQGHGASGVYFVPIEGSAIVPSATLGSSCPDCFSLLECVAWPAAAQSCGAGERRADSLEAAGAVASHAAGSGEREGDRGGDTAAQCEANCKECSVGYAPSLRSGLARLSAADG
jgi:hypothetical protein